MSAIEKHVDMDCKMADEKSDTPKVCLRAGQSIVSVKPVFSADGKYIFCVSGTNVKVLSTTGGGCLHELQGHTKTVTDICLNPKNTLQILTCSTDGSIKQWDYLDGVILREFQFPTPINGMLSYKHCAKLTVAVIQQKKTDEKGWELVKYDLSESQPEPQLILEHCSADRKHFDLGAEDKFIASIHKNKILTIVNLVTSEKLVFKNDAYNFTCLACHPTDKCIVIGDYSGKIHFWWRFWRKTKIVQSTHHWHSLPVKCLEFSAEGSHLLSGGHECVLVKWQYNSDNKDFLPRLGSPLNNITCSPDNTVYAISQDDNAVRLISNNYKPVCFYQGLTRGHLSSSVKYQSSTGLLHDPHSKSLVTNGRVGHLQFYNVHTDTQLFNLDITGQNYISPDSLSKDSIATQVTNATFNYSGKWLATTEYWADVHFSPEIRLKFWIFNEEKQSYTLNTSVEFPHEEQVYWLKFRPQCVHNKDLLMVVSTCQDGSFKLWTAEDTTDLYGTITKWMCDMCGTYRDLPAGQAQFTQDGSLLAVVFQSAVTLWNPDTNELKTTLHASMGDSKITNICFGNNNSSQYLVSTSDQHITVWNLLSLSIHWTVNVKVCVLVADPISNIMAAFSTDRQLFVFNPSKPEPIYTQSSVSTKYIIGAVFIPHIQENSQGQGELSWQKSSQLYFLNTDQQLLTIGYEEKGEDKYSTLSIKQNLPKTPFSQMLAEVSTRDKVPQLQSGYLEEKKTTLVHEMLKSSAHVQPPVTILCSKFLQSLLLTSQNKQTDIDEDADEDENIKIKTVSDSDSDVDMEDVSKPARKLEIKKSVILESNSDMDRNILKKEKLAVKAVLNEDVSWFSL